MFLSACLNEAYKICRYRQDEKWNYSYASNYCFEDIAPMPYDISEQEIICQVDKLLL